MAVKCNQVDLLGNERRAAFVDPPAYPEQSGPRTDNAETGSLFGIGDPLGARQLIVIPLLHQIVERGTDELMPRAYRSEELEIEV